ncbi:hypothetical protein ZIOFF_007754 [Zingiber officinale]|uniref:HVA22-like protein n=1 Tax=Zingiber officinale TaxID=94328 RepID=A0A8J5M485_ZINOF|nr:hypothetical protein ZIOFF_007754 [Zingiber officinale]
MMDGRISLSFNNYTAAPTPEQPKYNDKGEEILAVLIETKPEVYVYYDGEADDYYEEPCPAYECYKAVEINRLEIEQLRFWCQYWSVIALSPSTRVGDAFISWFPMHNEAKLAFYIYLWYPKTKGTTYIYQNLLQPFIEKHETEIDRNLLEFKTRTGGVMLQVWQKTAKYDQTRFFEILQDLASRYQSPQKHTVLVYIFS